MAPANTRGGSYPLFIEEMHKAGTISEKLFSIYITNYFDEAQKDAESQITIGGYNLQKYARPGQEVTWNSLISNAYWAVSLLGASLGDWDLETNTKMVILDSGTSYVMMPTADY